MDYQLPQAQGSLSSDGVAELSSGFSVEDQDSNSGYQRVREAAGYIDAGTETYSTLIKVSGGDAVEFLDRVFPGKLSYLQPYCALSTPVLDDKIKLIDFVQVLNLDDHFLILGSHSQKSKLIDFLQSHQAATEAVEICVQDEQLTSFIIEGPYAWKVAKDLVGGEVIGLRYLHAMDFELAESKAICLRGGITGEYGYRFILDKNALGPLLEELDAHPDFRPVPVSAQEIQVLAHETRIPVFGVTVMEGDCPIEMGIRYTLDFRKENYLYAEQLRNRCNEVSRSLVGFVIPGEGGEEIGQEPGTQIFFNGVPVGDFRYTSFSPMLGKQFGFAFLRNELAFPGVKQLVDPSKGRSIETTSTPFFETKSMHIVAE